jgi:hypothetical protein
MRVKLPTVGGFLRLRVDKLSFVRSCSVKSKARAACYAEYRMRD